MVYHVDQKKNVKYSCCCNAFRHVYKASLPSDVALHFDHTDIESMVYSCIDYEDDHIPFEDVLHALSILLFRVDCVDPHWDVSAKKWNNTIYPVIKEWCGWRVG